MLAVTEAFASLDDYVKYGGRVIPPADTAQALLKASDDINALCFGRARAQWDTLTEYQKTAIKRTVCLHADWVAENADLLRSILSSYSINGVSMGFNGSTWNVYVQSGIAISHPVYSLLRTTGLTRRTF